LPDAVTLGGVYDGGEAATVGMLCRVMRIVVEGDQFTATVMAYAIRAKVRERTIKCPVKVKVNGV